MSISFAAHQGSIASTTFYVSKNVTGSLTVEFSQNAKFNSVALTKTVTSSGGQVTLVLSAVEIDSLKDAHFRVKDSNGRVIETGILDYIVSTPQALTINDPALKAAFAASRAPYLGPVANRGRLAPGTISTSTYRQVRTWRAYRAADLIDAVALIYAGFANTTETAATATGQVSAVVEYPVGTYTRVKFGGADMGTVPPGGRVQSDLTKLAAVIPVGARFWIGTLVTWDAGKLAPVMKDTLLADPNYAVMRESGTATNSVTLTDNLMTGARDVSFGQLYAPSGDTYGPCAILGMTQRPTVFIAGDSRAMGALAPGISAQDVEGIVGEIEQILGNRVGYINTAMNSDSFPIANTGSNYVNRLALSQFCTHIVSNYGVNSIYQALATNITDFTTFRGKFPASKPFIQATCTPKITGNAILADLSDQTPGGFLAFMTAWNDWVRAGGNGLIDGCIDLEAVTSPFLGSGKIFPAQRAITDAAITTGTNTVTSATANFTSGDVGKYMLIIGAGASGASLLARITSVTNATTARLGDYAGNTNAGTTVTGAAAGIGMDSIDGIHQTKLREARIRESQLLQRGTGSILGAIR